MVAKFFALDNVVATARRVRIIGYPSVVPCAGLKHYLLSPVSETDSFAFFSELEALRFTNISVELRTPGVGGILYAHGATEDGPFRRICAREDEHKESHTGQQFHRCNIDGTCLRETERCIPNPLCAICVSIYYGGVRGDNSLDTPVPMARLPLARKIHKGGKGGAKKPTGASTSLVAAKHVNALLCPTGSRPKHCSENVCHRPGSECLCVYTKHGGSFHRCSSAKVHPDFREDARAVILADRLYVSQDGEQLDNAVLVVDQSRVPIVLRGNVFSNTGAIVLGPVRRASIHDNLHIGRLDVPSIFLIFTEKARIFSNTIVNGGVWTLFLGARPFARGDVNVHCNALLSTSATVIQSFGIFGPPTGPGLTDDRNTFLTTQTTPGVDALTYPAGTQVADVAEVTEDADFFRVGFPPPTVNFTDSANVPGGEATHFFVSLVAYRASCFSYDKENDRDSAFDVLGIFPTQYDTFNQITMTGPKREDCRRITLASKNIDDQDWSLLAGTDTTDLGGNRCQYGVATTYPTLPFQVALARNASFINPSGVAWCVTCGQLSLDPGVLGNCTDISTSLKATIIRAPSKATIWIAGTCDAADIKIRMGRDIVIKNMPGQTATITNIRDVKAEALFVVDGGAALKLVDLTLTDPGVGELPKVFGVLGKPGLNYLWFDGVTVQLMHGGIKATSNGAEVYRVERSTFRDINVAVHLTFVHSKPSGFGQAAMNGARNGYPVTFFQNNHVENVVSGLTIIANKQPAVTMVAKNNFIGCGEAIFATDYVHWSVSQVALGSGRFVPDGSGFPIYDAVGNFPVGGVFASAAAVDAALAAADIIAGGPANSQIWLTGMTLKPGHPSGLLSFLVIPPNFGDLGARTDRIRAGLVSGGTYRALINTYFIWANIISAASLGDKRSALVPIEQENPAERTWPGACTLIRSAAVLAGNALDSVKMRFTGRFAVMDDSGAATVVNRNTRIIIGDKEAPTAPSNNLLIGVNFLDVTTKLVIAVSLDPRSRITPEAKLPQNANAVVCKHCAFVGGFNNIEGIEDIAGSCKGFPHLYGQLVDAFFDAAHTRPFPTAADLTELQYIDVATTTIKPCRLGTRRGDVRITAEDEGCCVAPSNTVVTASPTLSPTLAPTTAPPTLAPTEAVTDAPTDAVTDAPTDAGPVVRQVIGDADEAVQADGETKKDAPAEWWEDPKYNPSGYHPKPHNVPVKTGKAARGGDGEWNGNGNGGNGNWNNGGHGHDGNNSTAGIVVVSIIGALLLILLIAGLVWWCWVPAVVVAPGATTYAGAGSRFPRYSHPPVDKGQTTVFPSSHTKGSGLTF